MSKEKVEKKGMNVFQKIHAVQSRITTIAKKGKNSFQNYEYATEADFVLAIKPLLNDVGLVIIPNLGGQISTHPQGKGILTSVAMIYKIVNIDDPADYTQVSVPAQGADNGDKGAYKAITGAKKYMLANTFMIATGDDPEKDKRTKKSAPLKTVNSDDDF